MKKRFLLIFLTLVLIMAVGCANEEPAEITDQSTDSVEEVEVARGIKIDYDVEYEQEIFGDAS